MKNAVIVLPTYNEADNIILILDAIFIQQEKMKDINLSVLVVDDSSPDGTSDLVKSYADLNSNVFLLGDGKKEGLGVAYIRGFRYATEKLNADIVLEMDADFSHNPNDIPRLIHAINMGSDFAIGSRYVEGGSIPEDWPMFRKANSKWGNIFARYVAGLRSVNDCTSGYRAISAELINKIDFDELDTKGYAFQISLLYSAFKNGAQITEVPIHFVDRVRGESKISLNDIREFILTSIGLRLNSLRQVFTVLRVVFILSILSISFAVIFINMSANYSWIIAALFLMALFMTGQGIFSIFTMLYAWEDADRIEENKTPKLFINPKSSFTALIPARHEHRVIGDTLKAVAHIDYPSFLVETLIICKDDDIKTIKKVQSVIASGKYPNMKLVTFSDAEPNKPHSLNIGLSRASNEVVVIFDAEDQPHRDIYKIVNTVMEKEDADVVQSGVQLMNFKSKWFSALNVLEYFFWFKSAMHFFSKVGMVPLGGNTVFFKRELLKDIGGWNENCLTEDAEIGLRMSAMGANIKVVYDERHVTREETPSSLSGFIKQRTRWNQGFIQIFLSGSWLKLEKPSQIILALYVLLLPQLQAVMFILIPIAILMAIFFKLPILIALLVLLPILILLLQFIIYNVGLYEFTRDYKLKYPLWMPFMLAVTFLPFQLVLGFSALRALVRTITGNSVWEKTAHTNAHRIGAEYSQAFLKS